MPVYQSDPDRRPDSDYEPGRLDHYVPGNRGRMMDARRTPVRVAGLRPEAGFVLIRVDGFEDEGAVWEVPLENTAHFQWEKGSATAGPGEVAAFREAISRCEGSTAVAARADRREATLREVARARQAAAAWLDGPGRLPRAPNIAPAEGRTDPLLWDALEGFLATRGAAGIEATFARVFVSNPYSGDCVKGHRLVLADLGLVDYAGPVPRDPAVFDGPWSRDARARHIVSRLGFLAELLPRLGLERMEVFRGMSFARLQPVENRTFVSSSLRRAVAEAHFTADPDGDGLLQRQRVTAGRVFMTFLETRAMNGVFREAECVLLHDGGALF